MQLDITRIQAAAAVAVVHSHIYWHVAPYIQILWVKSSVRFQSFNKNKSLWFNFLLRPRMFHLKRDDQPLWVVMLGNTFLHNANGSRLSDLINRNLSKWMNEWIFVLIRKRWINMILTHWTALKFWYCLVLVIYFQFLVVMHSLV